MVWRTRRFLPGTRARRTLPVHEGKHSFSPPSISRQPCSACSALSRVLKCGGMIGPGHRLRRGRADVCALRTIWRDGQYQRWAACLHAGTHDTRQRSLVSIHAHTLSHPRALQSGGITSGRLVAVVVHERLWCHAGATARAAAPGCSYRSNEGRRRAFG